MTQKSLLWAAPTSGDGASMYTEQETVRLFRAIIGDHPASEGIHYGVDGGDLTPAGVSGGTPQVTVQPGLAWVNGYFYWSTAVETMGSAEGVFLPINGTTGFRLVLRWTASTKDVRLAVKANTDGLSPIPGIQQDGTVWELSLATFTITTGGTVTLTDTRVYVHYGTKVNTGMIDDLAVSTAKLANQAVTQGKMGNGSVGTAQLIDANITQGKMGNGSVGTAQLIDTNITQAKMGNGSVGTAQLIDQNVTQGKLALQAVGTSQIADLGVTNAKLASQAVTQGKMGNGSVGTAQLIDENVTPAKIQNRIRRFFVPARPVHSSYVSEATDWGNAVNLPNGLTTSCGGVCAVPSDYASGMTAKLMVQSPSIGNVYVNGLAAWASVGEDLSVGGPSQNDTLASGTKTISNASKLQALHTFTIGNLSTSDMISFAFTRSGGAGGDTLPDDLWVYGWLIEYTADS